MALELKATDHSYYCSESKYYVNGCYNYGRCDYETWADFKDEWLDPGDLLNDDLNHVFRFDITESEETPGTFALWLFFILQRKGIYRPVWVKHITAEDIPEIEEFLKDRWEYLKKQWEEISDETTYR